jgi:hypothetical protein
MQTPQSPQSPTAGTTFRDADRGVLFYGLTPPRREVTPERADEIARVTLNRLAPLGLDALILYDVDAEDDRSQQERSFPFVPMMDPDLFRSRHLTAWPGPIVVYRAVGKYTPSELGDWMARADPQRLLTVLVGASSGQQAVRTTLEKAHRLRTQHAPDLSTGGVLIAERHAARTDEHLRMLGKQDAGCTFFVSQICYDLDHTRDLLSDYSYTCRDRGITPVPVVLTLAPCGSAKTLDFMTWLGIDIPRWVRNEILFSDNPLQESYEHCVDSARILISFCRRLGLPFGINVESVTNRKVEIEASVELAREFRGLLGRP